MISHRDRETGPRVVWSQHRGTQPNNGPVLLPDENTDHGRMGLTVWIMATMTLAFASGAVWAFWVWGI